MGRGCKPLEAWALESLAGAPNPGLERDAEGRFWLGGAQLTHSNHQQRLLWRLHGSVVTRRKQRGRVEYVWCGHLKCCTANAVGKGEAVLACSICTSGYMLERRGRRAAASEGQLAFMHTLDGWLPRDTWWWEARDLPGWKGTVDFFLRDSALVVQLDGKGHLYGSTYGDGLGVQQGWDLGCAAAAWAAGARMLRLHNDDWQEHGLALVQAAHQYAQRHQPSAMLMLSPSFWHEGCACGGGGHAYPGCVRQRVGATQPAKQGCLQGCWLLTW
jgi:hypothetical protein